MANKRATQKLVSFSENSEEMYKVQKDINNGWFISSIYPNGRNYVGILEKNNTEVPEGSVYIPARKKIKFST